MKFFKSILKYWILIVLVLQPILDIIAYFNFSTYITPISFIARTLILVFIVLYTFIKSKDKKKFILYIIHKMGKMIKKKSLINFKKN